MAVYIVSPLVLWAHLCRWLRGALPPAHQLVARGQGLVEYALILALIAIVVVGSLSLVGQRTSDVFDQINCSLNGGKMHQDNGNGNSNKCK